MFEGQNQQFFFDGDKRITGGSFTKFGIPCIDLGSNMVGLQLDLSLATLEKYLDTKSIDADNPLPILWSNGDHPHLTFFRRNMEVLDGLMGFLEENGYSVLVDKTPERVAKIIEERE